MEVYSLREVARAADVAVDQVRTAAEFEQIALLDGFFLQPAAVRLVRRLAKVDDKDRAPLTLLRSTQRKSGLPLAASGTLHAAAVALFLLASSLGLLRANDTETALKVQTPTRFVFMISPGPGGGGGGGGAAVPIPPPNAKVKAPALKKISTPAPRQRPYRPPPRPVTRGVPPPPRPVPPPPQPVPPAALPPRPLPVVQSAVIPFAGDDDDLAGLLAAPPAPPSASQGPGTGGGAGIGEGTGLGEGTGNGIGPGSGGGTGGGPYQPGSGIEPPTLQREVKPLYTDDGRRRGIEGDVVMEIVVQRDGTVGDVRVLRSLGAGLEQRAIAAVNQWKFSPARRRGQAVDVVVEVAVGFTLR